MQRIFEAKEQHSVSTRTKGELLMWCFNFTVALRCLHRLINRNQKTKIKEGVEK